MRHTIFLIAFIPILVFATPTVEFAEYNVQTGMLSANGTTAILDPGVDLITDQGEIGATIATRGRWNYREGPAPENTQWLQVISPTQGPSEWFPVTIIDEWIPDQTRTIEEIRATNETINLEAGLSVEIDTAGLNSTDEVSWRAEDVRSGQGFIPLTGRYLITHNTDQEIPITIVSTGHNPSDSVFFIEYLDGLDNWVHDGIDGPALSPNPVNLNGGIARLTSILFPGQRKEIQASKAEIPYLIDRRITYGGDTFELHYPVNLGITSQKIALIQNGMITSHGIFKQDLTCQPYGTPSLIKQIILPEIAANLGYTARTVGSDRVNLAQNVAWLDNDKLDSLVAHEAAHVQTFHLWKILSWLANKRPEFGKEKLLNLIWTLEAYAVLFEIDKFRFSNDSWIEDNAIGTIFPKWVSPKWGLRSLTQLIDITNGTVEPRLQYQLGLFLKVARDELEQLNGQIGYDVPTLCEYFGDPLNQQELLVGNVNRPLARRFKVLQAFSQYVTEINLGRGQHQPLIDWETNEVFTVDTDNTVLPTQYERGAGIGPQVKEGETMVMLFSWHPRFGYTNDVYFHVPLREPDLWQEAVIVEKETGRPVGLWNNWMNDWWLNRNIFDVPYHLGQLTMTPVSGLRRYNPGGSAPLDGSAEFSCFLFGNISRIPGVIPYDESTYSCEAIGQ